MKGDTAQTHKEPDFSSITPVYGHPFYQWAKKGAGNRSYGPAMVQGHLEVYPKVVRFVLMQGSVSCNTELQCWSSRKAWGDTSPGHTERSLLQRLPQAILQRFITITAARKC